MFRVAANLNYLFTEVDLADRYEAAAAVGFGGVETLVPYELDASDIARARGRSGVQQILINTPLGDVATQGMTLSTDADRRREFEASIDLAAEYLSALDCPRLHVVAGMAEPGDSDRALGTFVENLVWTSERLDGLGVVATIMIEPLNTRDNPNYLVSTTGDGLQVLAAVKAARPEAQIELQFDSYHLQIMEGDLTRRFAEIASSIGHVQVSSVPGRAEPTRGEINHDFFLGELVRLGYSGWVAGEYRPTDGTLASLEWARPYGVDPTGLVL